MEKRWETMKGERELKEKKEKQWKRERKQRKESGNKSWVTSPQWQLYALHCLPNIFTNNTSM